MSEQEQKPVAGPPPGLGFGPGRGPGMMGMPSQKAKDFKGSLRRLATYLKPHQGALVIVLVTAVLSTLFAILSPKIMGDATTAIFDGMIGKMKGETGAGIDFGYIGQILVVLAILFVVSAAFSYIQQYVMASVSQRVVYDLRQEVNRKLERLPLKYFDSRAHGDTMSRVVNDIETISSTLQQSLTQLITSLVTLVGVLAMMLWISWVMTLSVLITLPLSVMAIRAITPRSQKHFRGMTRSLGELNGHVEEMYTGHHVVKAFGYEKKSLQKFEGMNEKLYQSSWRAQFISGIVMPLMGFIGNLSYVLVCVVGSIFVIQGSITIGNVQAFLAYTRQFTMPISQTAQIANIIQSTIAAAERVFELLDEQEELPEEERKLSTEQARGEVRFERVDFGYKPDTLLIENMSIEVKPGQTVAIVGPTGAGKTTLINLLMRFYELNDGRITIDSMDIKEMKRRELRGLFGMVLQDTWLFNGTIRENIAYGRADATEEEIVQAAKAAYADHFIRTLPEGYDMVLNEEASNLSQGQKQLLTIARAILADPTILILDEATSSVDTRTEVHIQQAMNALMKGRTSFVIAHRLSTIRDADLILVMNKGTVIEQGTHDELLARDGFYADLYLSQFSGRRPVKEAG
ncbi:ABC transporter ATP-binding protein [Ammoniphilus sp. YIM 78166]|uniref:ABC transporter ATP-binding protein n=1 Tax=Ammoniphilus sp. YIM 78166 TaxID=1644106 RepID=UPI00106F799F|nr:ABC transporter ATP-binding protein [Ammoniphilus sp. YIM 78166]